MIIKSINIKNFFKTFFKFLWFVIVFNLFFILAMPDSYILNFLFYVFITSSFAYMIYFDEKLEDGFRKSLFNFGFFIIMLIFDLTLCYFFPGRLLVRYSEKYLDFLIYLCPENNIIVTNMIITAIFMSILMLKKREKRHKINKEKKF